MVRPTSKTLTGLELEIMRALWEREEATVEALAAVFSEEGRPLAPSSFRTMLSILRRKGYVTRRQVGRGFLYRAKIPMEDARKSMLSDLIGRVFDGSAGDLVAAMVKHGMVGKSDLAKARQLIQEKEKGE